MNPVNNMLTSILLAVILIGSVAIYGLDARVAWLTEQLNAANAELETRRAIPPSDSECAAWWFSTDIAAVKARICKVPKP